METFTKSLLLCLLCGVVVLPLQATDKETTVDEPESDSHMDGTPVRAGRPDDLPAREKAIPNIMKNDTPAVEHAVPVILNIPLKDFEPASPKGHYPPGHVMGRGKGHEIGKGKGHEKFDPPDDGGGE